MADPGAYHYSSPLAGFENAPPLPEDLTEDGKSFQNPPRESGLSRAYEEFTAPLHNGRKGGLYAVPSCPILISKRISLTISANHPLSDVHVYHFQHNPAQVKYAQELWERIRRECKPLFTPRHISSTSQPGLAICRDY